MTLMDFDSHPETAKLKPRTLPMFTGDSFSILNYDTDFLELVRSGKVQIHTADFESLSPGMVHLSDGTSFEADAMMAGTGWKHAPPMKFGRWAFHLGPARPAGVWCFRWHGCACADLHRNQLG